MTYIQIYVFSLFFFYKALFHIYIKDVDECVYGEKETRENVELLLYVSYMIFTGDRLNAHQNYLPLTERHKALEKFSIGLKRLMI